METENTIISGARASYAQLSDGRVLLRHSNDERKIIRPADCWIIRFRQIRKSMLKAGT